MLPADDRPLAADIWLLVQVRPDASGERARQDLVQVTAALGEQLDDVHIPLAPPASEIAMWLDEHLFYLLAPSALSDLAVKLEPQAIAASVAKIRAELGSPLFGVLAHDVRRDPLGVHGLLRDVEGTFGFVPTHSGDPGDAPRVTVAGDLRAADGRSVLMKVRPVDDFDRLEARARQFVEQSGAALDVTLVGPALREREAAETSRRGRVGVFTSLLAMLTLLLAVSLRRARPVFLLIATVASALAIFLALEPRVGLLDVPLLVLLVGFGCEGALHIHRISLRGWPSALILMTALLPMWVSPQPLWQDWSLCWCIGFAVLLLGTRAVYPAGLRMCGSGLHWPQTGFRLRPMLGVAAVTTCGLLVGGAWAIERMQQKPGYPLAVTDPGLAAVEGHLERWFFDPTQVVWASSRAPTPELALAEASAVARELVPTLGPTAIRIESPGSFVVPPEQLEARRSELKNIRLGDRLEQLRAILADHGMRPAAFGEFLTGAGNLERVPDPKTALEGPLQPWIAGLMRQDNSEAAYIADTRIHLRPGVPVPEVSLFKLHGPPRANLDVQANFDRRLGLYTLSGLWFGALFVWLGTRNMAIALASGLAALAAQSGLLLLIHIFGVAASPLLIPVILLTGAAGIIAGGRACRCVDQGQPFSAGGFLLTSLCQLAAALALLFSSVPLWREFGLMAACGSVLATGLGVFVAPGLYRMLNLVTAKLQERRP